MSNSLPDCPNCGKEMVFAAITVDSVFISCFLCDCYPQPDQITSDIQEARIEESTSLMYDITIDEENTAEIEETSGTAQPA